MENTIFVVDDSFSNLSAAEEVLENHYNVRFIPSGEKAIALLGKIIPHLILLDIEMPGMNGFEVLEHLKGDEKTKDIPVIFLTAITNVEIETNALEMGVVDFIIKPFSAPVLLNRIRLHIDISEIIKERTHQLLRAKQDIIFVLADVVENRDESTSDHINRTARTVKLLIDEMQEKGIYSDQIKEWDSSMMAECSLLHDVGKINTPDAILSKPGKLTEEEFEIMKSHTLAGENIINKIIARSGENKFLYNAKIFATYHHERWNGAGYPYGLKGEEIPLQGRIMAVADVYDALISERPYKKAIEAEQAIKIIMGEKGKHFDPNIVDIFYEIHRV